jgi:hypothetical protein
MCLGVFTPVPSLRSTPGRARAPFVARGRRQPVIE